MAFLRKRNKEDTIVKPVPSSPIPLAAAAAAVSTPLPLFARFATSTKNSNNGITASPRIVSSPMVLSSNARKELPQQRVSTRHVAPTRDLDVVAKRRTTQNQGLNKALPQVHSEQPPLVSILHAPIVDKPLPPPSSADPSGSIPTQSSMLGIKQSRALPSIVQNQPQSRPRTSLDDFGNRESKQQQQFNQPPTSQTESNSLISSNYSVPSPPGRNNSTSNTNLGPQILPPIANRTKMYQNSPASFGRQILPTTAQTQTPPRSVANQDLQPAYDSDNIGVPSDRMIQGTPVSDRGIDLPPEFALFQEFSQFTLKDVKDDVPASKSTLLQQNLSLPPPPPPPLPPTDMGVASSHVIANGLLPKVINQPQILHSSPREVRIQLPPRPSFQDLQQPVQYNSGSSRKSIAPMKGKPRIFAAMAAQEDELDQASVSVQPVVKKPPSQTTMYVQQQPQPQPSAPEYTNGIKADFRTFSNSLQPPVPSTPKVHIFEQLPPTPPSHGVSRSSRSNGTKSILKQEEQPQQQIPQTPPRVRKLSKARTPSDAGLLAHIHHPNGPLAHHHQNDSNITLPSTPDSHHRGGGNGSPRTLAKPRPTTPVAPIRKSSVASTMPGAPLEPAIQLNDSNITLPSTPDSHHRGGGGNGSTRTLTKSRPTTPVAPTRKTSFTSPMAGTPLESATQPNEDTISNAGIPLDDDPFARVEGVTLLKPTNSVKEKEREKEISSNGKKHRKKTSSKGPSISSLEDGSQEGKRASFVTASEEKASMEVEVVSPPTPISPEEHSKTKRKKKKKRHDDDNQTEQTPVSPPPMVDDEDAATAEDEPEPETEPEPEPEPVPSYTMAQFLSDPPLLSSLLTFLSFYDWCVVSSLSKEIRTLLVRTPELRETVLERFLKTVGYSRWFWDDPEPLSLSLQDLSDYMRGVSTPTHEYARIAGMYVHSLTVHPNHRDPSLLDTVGILTASTRAYTRVVLRLRAQAEKEAILAQQFRGPTIIRPPPNFNSPSRGTNSRVSSRAPSPTTSNYSHSHSHSNPHSHNGHGQQQNSSQTSLTFRSPLFRLRRAPLLRVFVPSPEGDWLSDKSVLACEAECKRAGVAHLMRLGDVVWDVAVGDEGNVGRLVWDGSYLIDLDYTYSTIGDLPKYMPTLAFPPSYFHRVIRTGPVVSNPIVHIDISPWGEEIAMNLQLLQDRVRTETPQGAYHNVVRWVHRSSFVIRPPRGLPRYIQQGGKTIQLPSRIPIPDSDNLFVDPGWYGTIVVETESTNEAIADLQERCGPGVFPPRSRGMVNQIQNRAQIENKKVFRILREKSRPNEIWMRAVGIKERLL